MLPDAPTGLTPPDWLSRYSAEEWLRQGVAELSRAEQLLSRRERGAAISSLKRAAGMALNGALLKRWPAGRPDSGRTYVEHLQALSGDAKAPAVVRDAARLLFETQAEAPTGIVRLTPPSESARWVEAAKTVMAHAYALVHGSTGQA
jgi:hypothetical protein